MRSERFTVWLPTLSNLGLIGGLVLLALQIQQTRDLTRLQMRLDRLGSFQQMEQAMLRRRPRHRMGEVNPGSRLAVRCRGQGGRQLSHQPAR